MEQPPPSFTLGDFLKLAFLGACAFGAAKGISALVSDDEEATTHNYELIDRGRTVYHGITDRPDERLDEHARAGKRFDTAVFDDEPQPRAVARDTEITRLADHRAENRGRNPRYNRKRNG